MNVEIPGDVQQFSAMPIGGFFRKMLSRRHDFGICVSIDGTQRAAIIFPELSAPPQLQVGGLPADVVYYPDAILRPGSFEFLNEDEFAFGSVYKAAGGNSYIRVTDGGGIGNYRTFDLQTGLQTNLQQGVARVVYSHWRVGVVIDGEFAEIFSWQPTA
jgi:hypothetical protein